MFVINYGQLMFLIINFNIKNARFYFFLIHIWLKKIILIFSINNYEYNIKHLSFGWCGHENRSTKWKSDTSLFTNIAVAISKCGLKSSLESINIYLCGLDKDAVAKTFNSLGLGGIQIYDDERDNYPLV